VGILSTEGGTSGLNPAGLMTRAPIPGKLLDMSCDRSQAYCRIRRWNDQADAGQAKSLAYSSLLEALALAFGAMPPTGNPSLVRHDTLLYYSKLRS
jgi:hypothetical protein